MSPVSAPTSIVARVARALPVRSAVNRPYSTDGDSPNTPRNASSNERFCRAVRRRHTKTRLESPRCSASHSRNAEPARYANDPPSNAPDEFKFSYRGSCPSSASSRSKAGRQTPCGTAGAGDAAFDESRIAFDHPPRSAYGDRSCVDRKRAPQVVEHTSAPRRARQVRDVAELVRDEHLAPVAKLADVVARVRRRGPQIDGRPFQERPRGAVGGRIRIVDDNLSLRRRRVPDELGDRRVDRVSALRDVPRPRFERERIMKSEVARFDRAPGQPGADDELRAGWAAAATRSRSAAARAAATGSSPVFLPARSGPATRWPEL